MKIFVLFVVHDNQFRNGIAHSIPACKSPVAPVAQIDQFTQSIPLAPVDPVAHFAPVSPFAPVTQITHWIPCIHWFPVAQVIHCIPWIHWFPVAQVTHCIHWTPVDPPDQLRISPLIKLYISPLVDAIIVPLLLVPKITLLVKLSILILPLLTSNFSCGIIVPIPMFPSGFMVKYSWCCIHQVSTPIKKTSGFESHHTSHISFVVTKRKLAALSGACSSI